MGRLDELNPPLYYRVMTTLERNGRWSGRIRKNLRKLLAAETNQNKLVNDLLEIYYRQDKGFK